MEDRQLIDEVLAAVARQDWATVTRCVHPYVHWTVGQERLRGRRNVLAMLATSPHVIAEPNSWELRDGQIYRWIAG